MRFTYVRGQPVRMDVQYAAQSKTFDKGFLFSHLGGTDLYGIHPGCFASGANFFFELLKPDGSKVRQTLFIGDGKGVSLSAASELVSAR